MENLQSQAPAICLVELEIIQSNVVFEKVIKQLPLDVSYYIRGDILETEFYKDSPFKLVYNVKDKSVYGIPFNIKFLNDKEYTLSYTEGSGEKSSLFKVGKTYENDKLKFSILINGKLPINIIGEDLYFLMNNENTQKKYISRNLTAVILSERAQTIKLSFTDNNPLKAKEVIESVVQSYLEATLANKKLATEQTLLFLEKQLDSTANKLNESEIQVEDFIKAKKSLNITGDMGRSIEGMKLAAAEKSRLRQESVILSDIIQAVARGDSISKFSYSLLQLNDPSITSTVDQLQEINDEIRLMGRTLNEGSLVYKLKQERITEQKKDLMIALENAIKLNNYDIQILDDSLSKIERNFYTLPAFETEFTRISRFLNLNEKYYLMLLERKAEFGINQASIVPDFQVLAPAGLPQDPISPVQSKIYIIGIAIGFVFGIGLVVARYALDDTIINHRDLERSVVAPLLGAIPTYHKERMDVSQLVVDRYPKSSVSETLRSIRTNVEFLSNKRKRVITVTSTIGGEGKTFVAINFAGIMAMSGQKVALVDLDMRKPKVHAAFQVEGTRGMSTLLIGKNSVEECMYDTPIENLKFIPAGPIPPNPSELMLRPEFDEFLEDLKKDFDIIVIDSPPVGLVTDGIIAMQKADLPLYVVRSAYSKRFFSTNINKLIKVNGFRNLAVILNAVDNFKTYGYGYGYGYEYYTDDERATGLDMSWIKRLVGSNS